MRDLPAFPGLSWYRAVVPPGCLTRRRGAGRGREAGETPPSRTGAWGQGVCRPPRFPERSPSGTAGHRLRNALSRLAGDAIRPLLRSLPTHSHISSQCTPESMARWMLGNKLVISETRDEGISAAAHLDVSFNADREKDRTSRILAMTSRRLRNRGEECLWRARFGVRIVNHPALRSIRAADVTGQVSVFLN